MSKLWDIRDKRLVAFDVKNSNGAYTLLALGFVYHVGDRNKAMMSKSFSSLKTDGQALPSAAAEAHGP